MTATKNKRQWQRVKWPFNDQEPYASWECWSIQIKKGRIILYPSDSSVYPGGLGYVVSCGADSERSHSGSFYPHVITLDEAKTDIERRIALDGF